MPQKISGYVADGTSDPITGDDLMDFSNWNGASFDVSKKITVDELMTYANANGSNIYNNDDTITGDRELTAQTYYTQWLGGDVHVKMSDEINDYAFKVLDISDSEMAVLGFDQASVSGQLSLYGDTGLYLQAVNKALITSNDTVIKALNGGCQLNLRDGGNDIFSLTTDNGTAGEANVYGNTTTVGMAVGSYGGVTVNNASGITISTFSAPHSIKISSGSTFSVGANYLQIDSAISMGVSDASAPYSNDNQCIYMANVNTASASTTNVSKMPVAISSQNATLTQDKTNMVVLAGSGVIGKTQGAACLEKLAFNAGASYETLITHTTATADRSIILPDADMDFESAITEVLTIAGGGSGDLATITIANGIVTARTLVP